MMPAPDAMAIDVLPALRLRMAMPCLHAIHQLQVTVLRALKLHAMHHFSSSIAASFNAQSTDQVG